MPAAGTLSHIVQKACKQQGGGVPKVRGSYGEFRFFFRVDPRDGLFQLGNGTEVVLLDGVEVKFVVLDQPVYRGKLWYERSHQSVVVEASQDRDVGGVGAEQIQEFIFNARVSRSRVQDVFIVRYPLPCNVCHAKTAPCAHCKDMNQALRRRRVALGLYINLPGTRNDPFLYKGLGLFGVRRAAFLVPLPEFPRDLGNSLKQPVNV